MPANFNATAGSFTIPNGNKVCVNSTLTVSPAPSITNNYRYFFDYKGNGLPPNTTTAPVSSTIYTAPGTYTILQVGSGGAGTLLCREVTVVSPTASLTITPRICNGNSVTLTYQLSAEAAQYDNILIQWGNGAESIPIVAGQQTGQTVRTYPMPGGGGTLNYTISAQVRINGSTCVGGSDTKQVQIRNPTFTTAPIINRLQSNANNTATLGVQLGGAGYTHTLLQKDPGSAVYVPKSASVVGPSFTVPAPTNQVTCFQLRSADACGTNPLLSREVCSLVLNGTADPGVNKLSWTPYQGTPSGFSFYSVRRDGPQIGIRAGVNANPTFDDFAITCQRYNYWLVAFAGPTEVYSNTVVLTGNDTKAIPPPTGLFVSVTGAGAVETVSSLSSTAPTPYTLVVQRGNGIGGPFTEIGTQAGNRFYTDQTAQPSTQSYCYRTALQNACGATSAFTPPACTIHLRQDPDGRLRWTTDSPFAGTAVSAYTLIPIDPLTQTPGNPIALTMPGQTGYQPDPTSQVTQYYISANAPIADSYSNTLQIKVAANIYVPDAFTPNGSGPSETERLMAIGPKPFWTTFEMTLYDRWGNVVYNTTNKDDPGWNGDINGQPAATGHYTYRVKVSDIEGKPFERLGRFMLLR